MTFFAIASSLELQLYLLQNTSQHLATLHIIFDGTTSCAQKGEHRQLPKIIKKNSSKIGS